MSCPFDRPGNGSGRVPIGVRSGGKRCSWLNYQPASRQSIASFGKNSADILGCSSRRVHTAGLRDPKVLAKSLGRWLGGLDGVTSLGTVLREELSFSVICRAESSFSRARAATARPLFDREQFCTLLNRGPLQCFVALKRFGLWTVRWRYEWLPAAFPCPRL